MKLGNDTAMMIARMNNTMLSSISEKPARARLLPVADVVIITFIAVGANGEQIVAVGNFLARVPVDVVTAPLVFADYRRVEVRAFPVRESSSARLRDQRLQSLFR